MIEPSSLSVLPIAWHALAKECMSDMQTASNISCSHLYLNLFEKEDGELGIKATVLFSEIEQFSNLIYRIGRKAIDSVSKFCCVCGYEGPCTLLIFAQVSRWCCDRHEKLAANWVPRGCVRLKRSHWDVERVLSVEDAAEYATHNELALKDARDLEAKHENEISRQFLAKVSSLIALDAINELLDTKAKSCTS